MNDRGAILELFRHMEWADSIVWAAVLARSEAEGDAGLRERLHHLHLVQRAFLQVWRGGYAGPQASSFDESRALLSWAREYYAEVSGYLSRLDEVNLDQPVEVPWTRMFETRLGRRAEIPTLSETLLQVLMHSTYHRGQINTRLRELGAEPPLTDFIVWIWAGKPAPVWPA